MDDEAAYICPSCGEEIIIPIDLTAGREQQYIEDCPVCCAPNIITVRLGDGEIADVSVQPE